jgi:hypothetical protein
MWRRSLQRETAMADPKPCEECRNLVTRNVRLDRPHDTLEWVRNRPDIGPQPLDIRSETEYQCVICGSVLVSSMDRLNLGWRFGE